MRTAPVLLVLALLVTGSGCATFVRSQNQPAPRQGINLVSIRPLPALAVRVNDQETTPRLVYDGSTGDSPFYVYRVPVSGAPRELLLDVSDGTATQRYRVEGVRAPDGVANGALALLFGQGLWALVDRGTGAYRAYPDLLLETAP